MDARLHYAIYDARRERGSRQAPPISVSDAPAHAGTDTDAAANAGTNRNTPSDAGTDVPTVTGSHGNTRASTLAPRCNTASVYRTGRVPPIGDHRPPTIVGVTRSYGR